MTTILPANAKIKMLKNANEIVYKKGYTKDAGIKHVMYRGAGADSSHPAYNYSFLLILKANLKTPDSDNGYNFEKIYINNIDEIKGIGNFFGFYKNEQEQLSTTQVRYMKNVISAYTAFPFTNIALRYCGWMLTGKYISDIGTWSRDIRGGNTADLSGAAYTALGGDFDIAHVTDFRRITGTCELANILIPQSIQYDRFTDYDRIGYNYSNDNTINNSTYKAPNVFKNVQTRLMMTVTYIDGKDWTVELPLNTNQVDDDFVPPYEGFANTTLTNWNQIYNSAFDIVASTYNDGVVLDSKGVKHLMSYAGLPIALLKKDQSLEYELKFEDTTKEYDVWVKLSPFGDKVQDSESGLETNISAKRGNTSINLGANKYLTVKSGDILVVDNADKEGYVFIKWREKGDTSYGGGTLISTGEARIIKQG